MSNAIADPSPLYTVQEVAAILKIAERTVYDLIRDGRPEKRLPAVKVGGQWRLPREAIDRLARGESVESR